MPANHVSFSGKLATRTFIFADSYLVDAAVVNLEMFIIYVTSVVA